MSFLYAYKGKYNQSNKSENRDFVNDKVNFSTEIYNALEFNIKTKLNDIQDCVKD